MRKNILCVVAISIFMFLCPLVAKTQNIYYSKIQLQMGEAARLTNEGLPAKAIEKYNEVLKKANLKKEPKIVLEASLRKYVLEIDNGFVEIESVLGELDVLKKKLPIPLNSVVSMSLIEIYCELYLKSKAIFNKYTSSCDSIPLKEWSKNNYIEKIGQLIDEIIADEKALSSSDITSFIPFYSSGVQIDNTINGAEVLGNSIAVVLDRFNSGLFNTPDASTALYNKNLEFHKRNSSTSSSLLYEAHYNAGDTLENILNRAASTQAEGIIRRLYAYKLALNGEYEKAAKLYKVVLNIFDDSVLKNIFDIIYKKRLETNNQYFDLLPDREWQFEFSSRNIDTLYFEVCRIPESVTILELIGVKENSINQQLLDKCKNRIKIKKCVGILSHDMVDNKVDMLPLIEGNYIITVSYADNSDEKLYMFVPVSKLQCINFGAQGIIIDKTNGKPVVGARVDVADIGNRVLSTYTTNEIGFFDFTNLIANNRYNNIIISVAKDGKYTFFNSTIFNNFYSEKGGLASEKEFVQIMTNKPIYKPSEVVKFNLLMYVSKNNLRKVAANRDITVEIEDEETELLQKLELKTNEFGTVSAQFKVPKGYPYNTLTISAGDFSMDLPIEEYKVPEIEVIFDEDFVEVGSDSLKFSGKVLSSNSMAIDRASVSYWNYDEKLNYSSTTDSAGVFSIVLPFNSEINRLNVVATSPTGHIAKGSKYISTDKYFTVNTHSSNVININNRENYPYLSLSSYNRRCDREVKLKIFKKKYFTCKCELCKKRGIDNELREGMSEFVFEKVSQSIDSLNSAIKAYKFSPAAYYLEVEYEHNDKKQSSRADFIIMSPTSKKSVQYSNDIYYYSPKVVCEAGDTLKFIVGGGCDTAFISTFVSRNNKLELLGYSVKNRDEQIVLEVPIREIDIREGSVKMIYSINGVLRLIQIPILVKKEELNVRVETIRSRILSGSKNSINISVKDSKGNPLDAEVFINMENQLLLRNVNRNRFYIHSIGDLTDLSIMRNYSLFFGTFKQISLNNYLYKPTRLNTPFTNFVTPIRFNGGYRLLDGIAIRGYSTGLTLGSEPNNKNIRTNFDDSGLFLTGLHTDAKGMVNVDFTAPEYIGKWSLNIFVHTKNLLFKNLGYILNTYKNVIVSINKPRYMRHDDTVMLSARVDNLTNSDIVCDAEIFLEGADCEFDQPQTKKVAIKANSSETVTWRVAPKGDVEMFYCTIKAGNESYQDGERIIVPFLRNRELITRTKSEIVAAGKKKILSIDSVGQNSGDRYRVKIDIVKNPLWLVLETLPVAADQGDELTIHIFNKLFANLIASYVKDSLSNSVEQLIKERKATIRFKESDITTPLNANEDVKQILIENSSWAKDAVSEYERSKRLIAFYDNKYFDDDVDLLQDRFFERQSGDGYFMFFNTPSNTLNVHTNLYIAELSAKLIELNLLDISDKKICDKYKKLISALDLYFKNNETSSNNRIYYNYVRSIYNNLEGFDKVALDIKGLINNKWQSLPIHTQSQCAIAAYNNGETKLAYSIVASLLNKAIKGKNGELYWQSSWGCDWFNRPIETHFSVVEMLRRIDKVKYSEYILGLRNWLLINKKSNSWGYSTATVMACYALLMGSNVDMANEDNVRLKIGGKNIELPNNNNSLEFFGNRIDNKLREISVENLSATMPTFVSIYSQSYEDLDKIKSSSNVIAINRQLMLKDAKGGYTEVTKVKIGDVVKVRMVLTTEREMEYVHLRDNRAMSLEPLRITPYLPYRFDCYMVSRNSCTDFFIDKLTKGTHIIEYETVVTYDGDISGGYAEVQSLFAPEVRALSNGCRLTM